MFRNRFRTAVFALASATLVTAGVLPQIDGTNNADTIDASYDPPPTDNAESIDGRAGKGVIGSRIGLKTNAELFDAERGGVVWREDDLGSRREKRVTRLSRGDTWRREGTPPRASLQSSGRRVRRPTQLRAADRSWWPRWREESTTGGVLGVGGSVRR